MNWKLSKARISWISAALFLFATAAVIGQTLDDLEVTQPDLSDQELRSATSWGLTETEWQRHQELRTLRRGLVSTDVTPLEILGIYADSDADRKRYAKLFAHQQIDLLDRVALFESDYLEAVRELTRSGSSSSGRYRLVAAIDCTTSQCSEQLKRGLKLAESHGLDIFLTGTAGADARVRNWAVRNSIPPDAVRSRRITLNHAPQGMRRGLYQ